MKPRFLVPVITVGLALLGMGAYSGVAPVNTEIVAEHLVSSYDEKADLVTTVFDGNVVITGTNIRMTCDHLVVISTRKGDKEALVTNQNQFKSLVATGHVSITQGTRNATCGRAEVFPQDDKIILTDNPIVVDPEIDYYMRGEKMALYRGQRKVDVDKPVLTGPAIKDLGFDKNTKPDENKPAKQ